MSEPIIVLLLKKGKKSNPLNYRPISLLQSTLKILDKWIMQKIKPILIEMGDLATANMDSGKTNPALNRFST